MFKFKKKSPTNNKKVFGATPTTKYGIDFKSKLEAYTYDKLLKAKLVFTYEETKFTLLPKAKNKFFLYVSKKVRGKSTKELVLDNRSTLAMTYTPDFIVKHKNTTYVIETKGFETDSFKVKIKLFKHLLNDMSLKGHYALMIPKSQKQVNECIRIIMES